MPTFGGFLPAAYPPHCVCTLAHCPTLHILEVTSKRMPDTVWARVHLSCLAVYFFFFFFFCEAVMEPAGNRSRREKGQRVVPPPPPPFPLVRLLSQISLLSVDRTGRTCPISRAAPDGRPLEWSTPSKTPHMLPHLPQESVSLWEPSVDSPYRPFCEAVSTVSSLSPGRPSP